MEYKKSVIGLGERARARAAFAMRHSHTSAISVPIVEKNTQACVCVRRTHGCCASSNPDGTIAVKLKLNEV